MRLSPGRVLAVAPPYMQVLLLDSYETLQQVVQPTLSGALAAGWFSMPAAGDRVIVAYWADGTPFCLCGLSAWDRLAGSVPTGQPHEQYLYGPAGQVLAMVAGGDASLVAPDGQVRLGGASGGAAVARVGDSVQVSLSSGSGTITGGSGKVTAS